MLDSAVTAPVHSGPYSLAGAASSSDDAQCSQKVTVAPSTAYTFTASAFNAAGEGPQSAAVHVTTAASGGGDTSPGSGNSAVAPYVDMTNLQEPMLDKAATTAGLKAFPAALVIGAGCTAIWGDTLPVTSDPTVNEGAQVPRGLAADQADGRGQPW